MFTNLLNNCGPRIQSVKKCSNPLYISMFSLKEGKLARKSLMSLLWSKAF